LPFFPWHDAQYAWYKSAPSTDRINVCCFSESSGFCVICEPVCAFAPAPAATVALIATNKNHHTLRIVITVLSRKVAYPVPTLAKHCHLPVVDTLKTIKGGGIG
jgi:hypothetical protein